MVDTTLEIWQRDQTAPAGPPTKVADVTHAWGRRFTHEKNDYGSARLNIQLSDATAAAAALPGRIVKFKRGSGYHAFVLGPRQIRRVQRGEESEHVLAFEAAPGVLSVLNDGRVQPTNGVGWQPWERRRRWDWTNPELDTSGWGNAVELWRQGAVANLSASDFIEVVRDQGRFAYTPPEGYHDANSMWVWSSNYLGSPGSGGSGTLHMTPGESFFHREITLTDDTYCLFQAGCDDFFELAIDGVVLITTADAPEEAWSRAREWKGMLSAGTHTIRIRAQNYARLFTNGNIAGLVAALYEIAPATETIVSTIVRTDDTWKCLDYPADPPGFTVGDVLLIHLAELQALGFLTDVDPTFTGLVDTDGNAWPLVSDIVTTVGDPFGEATRQICVDHADVRMNHNLTFDAWVPGQAGSASGVTYAIGTNIESLEFDGDTPEVSSLLVLHEEGFALLGDSSAHRQEYLDLSGSAASEALVTGAAHLDDLQNERWAATIRVEPQGSDRPLDDVNVFDTATVPNPTGTTSTVECVAISWGEDDQANEVLEPVFGDVILTPEERSAQLQRAAAVGQLAGRVPLPPPIGQGGAAATTPQGAGGGTFTPVARTFEFPFHRDATVVDVTSDAWPVGAARTVFEFAVHIGAAQAGDVDVVLELSGTPVATVTIAAGDTYHLDGGLSIPLAKDTDRLTVSCVDTGFSIVAVARAR